MIKVAKNYEEPPAVLISENCIRQIKEAVEKKSGDRYSTYYYRHNEVLSNLKEKIYHKKCAYCESKCEHVAKLQVEHFRPKNGLKKEKPGDETHNGYYWLGNEWSNLLLSCPICNEPDAKGTRFPIAGERVYDGSPFDSSSEIDSFDRTRLMATNSPLMDEKPLLLNPEYDEPKDHLEFDNLGQIKGITERGNVTIDICKLNRDALYLERQEIVNQFVDNIKIYVFIFETKYKNIDREAYFLLLDSEFEKIMKRTKPEEEYTLWGRFIFNEFEDCILRRINSVDREPIREAFKRYCSRLPEEERNF
ncbi:MAG TPA: hypothetical protein VK469_24870 [Candidatus Kapabacteria bacterium]|nr:hypothetical protein [Candidatus Kapabacteria bacterium]